MTSRALKIGGRHKTRIRHSSRDSVMEQQVQLPPNTTKRGGSRRDIPDAQGEADAARRGKVVTDDSVLLITKKRPSSSPLAEAWLPCFAVQLTGHI